jgi:predicted transcriptional regulator
MARHTSPALTDAEARVMAVMWGRDSATVADVVTALRKKHPVTYSTAQTILRILERKGYVAHEKIARAFVYQAVIDERQARQRAWRHLVNRLFEGSPSLLVLNVLDDDDLPPEELERLKKVIDEA